MLTVRRIKYTLYGEYGTYDTTAVIHIVWRPSHIQQKDRNVQAEVLLDIKRKVHFGKQIALTTAANAHTLEPKIKIFFYSEKPP